LHDHVTANYVTFVIAIRNIMTGKRNCCSFNHKSNPENPRLTIGQALICFSKSISLPADHRRWHWKQVYFRWADSVINLL